MGGEETKLTKKKRGRKKGCGIRASEELIEDFKKIHGKTYDYSKTEYVGANTKVIIICLIHGEFQQRSHDHRRGVGCPKCGQIKKGRSRSLGRDEFIRRAVQIHGGTYDYSKVEYIQEKKVITIGCPVHGDFIMTPSCHTWLEQGCPKCKSSKGETRVMRILDKLGITYVYQWKTPGCRYKRLLPFDFFLPGLNVIIEVDGMQHYEFINFSHKPLGEDEMKIAFELTVEKDRIKNEFCYKNNIKMVRIPYWDVFSKDKNKLESIINNILK